MGAQRNSPKSTGTPAAGKSPTLQFLFDLDSKTCSSTQNNDKKIQSFDSEDEELSSIIFYCTESSPENQESPLKRLRLTQLLSIIKTSRTPLSDQTLQNLFVMLASNLFRPLRPPCSSTVSVFPDEDDVIASPSAAWAHLQVVYDILLRLVIKTDVQSLRGEQFIGRNFILNLLSLFNSDDPRERDAVKNVIHRIYSKFTFYRSFMRKSMTDVFLHYVYDTDQQHNRIGEILEIWGSIINGFTVPLKEEHKVFLIRVLIPLHKPKNMQVYHRQLAYCVSEFVQKEAELAGDVIRGILKYWPVTNCQKEVLLIGEVEEVVESIDRRQYLTVAIPLCRRITKCINSWNSQVAERALYVWNNEQFVKVVSQEIDKVFPILVEGMEKNLKWHWSKSVRQLTENVKNMLEELEPLLYSKCLERIEIRELEAQKQENMRREKWKQIEMTAKVDNQFL